MIIAKDIAELKNARSSFDGFRVAFVPTMGNLHDGHLSLIELAKKEADKVVASIFVNPLQFSPGEDLDSYPRTFADDVKKLQGSGVDLLFAPTETVLFPNGRASQTQVLVPEISKVLCGASRPNFFQGIASIVTKLFNLVRPDVAVFGQKDFQQWLVIKKLVADLSLPVELKLAPIVREKNGLAMSSRNNYLSDNERDVASKLSRSLQRIKHDFSLLESEKKELEQYFELDYLTIRRQIDLSESLLGSQLIVMAAVNFNGTRLIDNVMVDNEND